MHNIPIITLDGPSGSGKGTISKLIAKHLNWHLLDSGALYRLVALVAEQHRINLTNGAAIAAVAVHLDVQFNTLDDTVQIVLEGEDVTLAISSEQCAMNASRIATHVLVRKALKARQRAFAKSPGLVADGRDMGTVIFPHAHLKIFLTASAEERANRRYKQLKNNSINASLPDVLADIKQRDERDLSRSIAPLKPAQDATLLDCTGMSISEVFAQLRSLIKIQDFKTQG